MQDYKPVNSRSRGNKEGICCRLLNYIDNALFPWRSKHPESDEHHKLVMEEQPVVEGKSKLLNGLSKSKIRGRGSNSGSEIEIDFRHTEVEQEIWNNGKGRKHGVQNMQSGPEKKSINGEFQGPVAKKSVEIKDSAGKIQASQKLKQIDGEMKTNHAGHSRPISRVNSNHGSAIEEFLKTRKEAMRRYYSMDPKEKQ